jgi:hypothetical protein
MWFCPSGGLVTSTGDGGDSGPVRVDGLTRDEGLRRAGEQGLLFDDVVSTVPEDVGYRGPVACSAVGITYRQLD